MMITFSLKQRETRTGSGSICDPLRNKSKICISYVFLFPPENRTGLATNNFHLHDIIWLNIVHYWV